LKGLPLSEQKVTIYSDGGAKPNPNGVGGWAALLIWGEYEKEISGGERNTTNNKMELTAAIHALEAFTRPCTVEFYTDSEYLKNGITSWIKNWQRNGWKTSSGDPVQNQDLWMKLLTLSQKHKIDWHWTRGHAGDPRNERVDQLATQARLKVMRGS
jgi:ribonuclease HI